MKKLIPAIAVLLLAAGAATVASAAVPPDVAEYARTFERFPATKGQGSESERLHKLFDLFWEFQMHASPEYATFVGYPGLNTAGPTSLPNRSSSAGASIRRSRRR